MFGLGHWELLIILFIILLIFGVGKLPEIGGGLGKAIRGFKKGISDTKSEEKTETEKIEDK
jgi:sec-independent protein translocase protein TatA